MKLEIRSFWLGYFVGIVVAMLCWIGMLILANYYS